MRFSSSVVARMHASLALPAPVLRCHRLYISLNRRRSHLHTRGSQALPARSRPQLHRPQGYERVRCKDVVSGGRWKRAAHGWWHIFASIPSPRFMLVRHPQLDQLFDAVGLARVGTGVGRHLRLEQLVDSVGLAWVEKGLMAWGGVCVVPLTA